MICIIDHYDSFVETLARYVREMGYAARVLTQDTPLEEIRAQNPKGFILSPGPGGPEKTGVSLQIIRAFNNTPILGVCLGHQALALAYGARIGATPCPRHGKAEDIFYAAQPNSFTQPTPASTPHPLFCDIASPFSAGLYHSLGVLTLPPCLHALAHNRAGDIMALAHKTHPHFGVQFHPESILTPDGRQMIKNFLTLIA